MRKQWKSNNHQEGGLAVENQNEQSIEEMLWPAVEDGLLEEIFPDPLASTVSIQYKFTHDKVRLVAR